MNEQVSPSVTERPHRPAGHRWPPELRKRYRELLVGIEPVVLTLEVTPGLRGAVVEIRDADGRRLAVEGVGHRYLGDFRSRVKSTSKALLDQVLRVRLRPPDEIARYAAGAWTPKP